MILRSPRFRRLLPLVCCGSLLLAAASPSPAEPPPAASRAAPLIQPTSLPNNLPLDQPALPPIAPILARAKNNPYVYGLYVWTDEYLRLRDSIRQVGWRMFRFGGKYDDDIVRQIVADDVEWVPTIGPKPKPDADPAGDEVFLNAATDGLARFAMRYGPGGTFFKEHPDLPDRPVRYVEIANEPNFQYFIKPDGRPGMEQESGREALYAKYLPAAWNAVQKANPQVKLVGFSTGGSGAGDMRFVQHVLDRAPDAAHSFDIFSTHPYVDPAPPECYSHHSWGKYSVASSLETLRQTLAGHGRGDVPVWYTEVGWQVAGEDGGRYPTPREKSITPELQAAYTCRLYALAMRLGVERVTNMHAYDTDHYNGGFFLQDGTWRPSAHAVQTMIQLMPAPKLLAALSDGADGYFAYRFSPGPDPAAKPVLMLWNVAGPKTVEISMEGATATVTDMLGHAREVSVPSGGKLSVEAGPLPVYVAEAK